jgi:hypothetical protein
MSQVHIDPDHYVPGPVIYCPWSIIIAWRMALGLSNYVPGPYFSWSICPRACHFLSLVHHYCLNNGPGTIKPCPWARYFLSLVHHYCLKNGPGTIENCPRSIFTVVVWDVPGPSLLLEDWTRDYWNLSQVQFHSCQSIITGYHPYEHWENSISLGRTMIFPTLSWNTTCRYVRSN